MIVHRSDLTIQDPTSIRSEGPKAPSSSNNTKTNAKTAPRPDQVGRDPRGVSPGSYGQRSGNELLPTHEACTSDGAGGASSGPINTTLDEAVRNARRAIWTTALFRDVEATRGKQLASVAKGDPRVTDLYRDVAATRGEQLGSVAKGDPRVTGLYRDVEASRGEQLASVANKCDPRVADLHGDAGPLGEVAADAENREALKDDIVQETAVMWQEYLAGKVDWNAMTDKLSSAFRNYIELNGGKDREASMREFVDDLEAAYDARVRALDSEGGPSVTASEQAGAEQLQGLGNLMIENLDAPTADRSASDAIAARAAAIWEEHLNGGELDTEALAALYEEYQSAIRAALPADDVNPALTDEQVKQYFAADIEKQVAKSYAKDGFTDDERKKYETLEQGNDLATAMRDIFADRP